MEMTETTQRTRAKNDCSTLYIIPKNKKTVPYASKRTEPFFTYIIYPLKYLTAALNIPIS